MSSLTDDSIGSSKSLRLMCTCFSRVFGIRTLREKRIYSIFLRNLFIALFILGQKIRREKHFSHQFSRPDFTLGKEKTLRIETNHAVLLKFIIRNKRWGNVK